MYASYKVKASRKRKPTISQKISASIAARKRAIGRAVRRPELKYGDATAAPGAVPAGAYISCINQIAAGTDYGQRIGRQVIGRYVQVDCHLAAPTLAAATDYGLVALVVDTGAEGVLPAFGDIYAGFAGYLGMAFRNIAVNGERFKILKQATYMVQNATNGPVLEWRQRWMVRIPLKYSRVRFTAAGGGVPETNSILMVIISEANSGSVVTSPDMRLTTRFAFVDP